MYTNYLICPKVVTMANASMPTWLWSLPTNLGVAK